MTPNNLAKSWIKLYLFSDITHLHKFSSTYMFALLSSPAKELPSSSSKSWNGGQALIRWKSREFHKFELGIALIP